MDRGTSLAPFLKFIILKNQDVRFESGAPPALFPKSGIQTGYKMGYKGVWQTYAIPTDF